MSDMDITALLEAGARNGGATLGTLGGIEAIVANTDFIAEGPFFDLLVPVAAAAEDPDRAQLVAVLLRAFSISAHPSAFHDALNFLLECDELRPEVSGRLVPILEERIGKRREAANDLIAAYALEAMFRLALEQSSARYRVLAAMVELQTDEPPLFAEHAAKIVGTAYHQWGDDELLKTLVVLQNNEASESEAAFELGAAALSDALNAHSFEGIRVGLLQARELFALALSSDSERLDASAYIAVIDVLRAFSGNEIARDLNEAVNRLDRLVEERQDLLAIGTVPLWLRPRCDREVEWLRLLSTVRRVAAQLERPSWLNAASVLEQVLSIYDAERTVAIGNGLNSLFAPRIEASFVRSQGLAAHLFDLLSDEEWDTPYRATAHKLRSSILRGETSASPIEKEGADFPLLNGVLLNGAAGELPSAMAERLEAALEDHLRLRIRISNPIVQRIFRNITLELDALQDYRGEVKDNFDRLLLQILMFCGDRQDSDKRTTGTRLDYLRRADASESDLQWDLREFLRGNLFDADVLSEVPGVAAGRTDIYVANSACRFIIELKKHEGEANHQAARLYRGQAAAYQATNVRLGFLGMLELLDRSGPPAHLEECVWLDSYTPVGGSALPRYVVAFRVPGLLKTPSYFSR